MPKIPGEGHSVHAEGLAKQSKGEFIFMKS